MHLCHAKPVEAQRDCPLVISGQKRRSIMTTKNRRKRFCCCCEGSKFCYCSLLGQSTSTVTGYRILSTGHHSSLSAKLLSNPTCKTEPRTPIKIAMAFAPITIISIFAVLTIAPIFAKDFTVGDNEDWKHNFTYQAWAEEEEFVVEDKLCGVFVFKYSPGAHNVFRVNGAGFQQCIILPVSKALARGNDAITLTAPGRKWYICGVAKHCEVGNQNLAITVLSKSVSPAPLPSGIEGPTSAVQGIAASAYLWEWLQSPAYL